MKEHPAGGVPLWLLEVGSQTLLSIASLSHYYYFGDSFTPADMPQDMDGHAPPHQDSLVIDTKTIIWLIKCFLPHRGTPPAAGQSEGSYSHETAATHPPISPTKKTVKVRRKGSNQVPDDDVCVIAPMTVVTDGLADDSFNVRNFVSDEDALRYALQQASRSLKGKDVVTMTDFVQFCETTLEDVALDAIMHRFFAHSVMPSPTVELEIVRSRWREWQETDYAHIKKTLKESDSMFDVLTQSVRKMFLIQNDDSTEVSCDKRTISRPFGGLGGFDGHGAMGFGIMYCVDKAWWDAWVSYVGWTWSKDTKVINNRKVSRKRQRPALISSEPMLDRMSDDVVPGTLGSYELMKRDLRKDIDYVLVPSSVWDVLYEMYGGGPPLPRFVLPPRARNGNVESESIASTGNGHHDPGDSEVDTGTRAGQLSKIPRYLEVCTHPWVFHFHLCDPHQPYRRGDAGALSIRVMSSPDQPLWRLYAEVVVRLPFHLYRIYDSAERGRARIWKRTEVGTPAKGGNAFGPWALLCKNRFALIPSPADFEESDERWGALKQDWKAYTDNASVEDIGLMDGDQMMVECAIVTRNGDFGWPREAAAKASRVKRLEDQDVKFRRFLKGVDDKGNALSDPPDLVGTRVDATDASGKWFEVEIKRVQKTTVETDEEEDSTELEHDEEPGNVGGEATLVLVNFAEHGGHNEWINVESDRLASPGRYTAGTADDRADPPKGPTPSSSNPSGQAAKSQPQIKKATDPDSNAKQCSIPGYGACGLLNLGNTCYANSAIQCVSYLPILRAYLLGAQYKATGDLNKDNPLGTEGKLLEEFADLLRFMWSAKIGEKSPKSFRYALGKANELFQGADQQDSQEFLSFILDVLHEDSNRVRKKPIVEGLEDDWKKITSLPRVGEEEWRRYALSCRYWNDQIVLG